MRIILMATLLLLCTFGAYAEEGLPTESVLENIEVQEIAVDIDFRLKDGFDYSEYYGVIRSEGDFKKLWSNVVDMRGGFLDRMLGISPKRPEVDFDKHMVIWFAHKGANASFAKSVDVKADREQGVVIATVTAYHSDFGSNGFNLWEIPKSDAKVFFEILNEYENRGP